MLDHQILFGIPAFSYPPVFPFWGKETEKLWNMGLSCVTLFGIMGSYKGSLYEKALKVTDTYMPVPV